MKLVKNLFILITLIIACSCGENTTYVPRPKGFNHISLPEHSYVTIKDAKQSLPYTFEVSTLAKVYDDTTNWKNKKKYYKIIDYPQFDSKIHITYKEIHNNEDSLYSFLKESFRLMDGHNKKAHSIEERAETIGKHPVIFFELEGEVPSTYQFCTHDTSTHFLRGALYLQVADKNDSLAPIIDYVKQDIDHLIETLEWND